MKNPEDIKAWAERQKDDQYSTADDKRREKLKSLMRDFSRILPQGLTVEEAARHPLNIVMFDIFDELKARYIDIETLEGSLVQPELLYFVAKITQETNDTSEPSGDFDKNGDLVQWEKKGHPEVIPNSHNFLICLLRTKAIKASNKL